MGRFRRTRGKTMLHLDPEELALLVQTVNEFIGVVDDQSPTDPDEVEENPDDPFAVWEKSFGSVPSIEDDALPDADGDDPVTRRLFPPAYVDDAAAASDFQRFTQAEQRRAKIADALVVLDDLEDLQSGVMRVPTDHLDAWLKTLNNVRLVLSVILGISDETSHDEAAHRPDSDPRSWLYGYYGWLGWMLESLLECVMAPE